MKLALSALLLSSTLAMPLVAQAPAAPDAPPPPPPPGMHHGGPHGPGMFGPGMFGPGMEARRAETISNSPFTAKFSGTSTFTTRDGKQQQRSSTSLLYRDGQGRVREETTVPPPPPPPASATGTTPAAPATPGAPRTMVVILDPVAHTITRLNSDRKTAVVQTVPADFFTRMQARDERLASAASTDASATKVPGDHRGTTTDLGNKVIAGVPVAGKRMIHTAPARDGEAARTMTHEVWYSPDAKFEVSSSESGDRMSHTSTLTSFSKAEPDASLFKVPAGYTTEAARDHGFGPHGGRHRGPGGPDAPAGPDAPPPPPAPSM